MKTLCKHVWCPWLNNQKGVALLLVLLVVSLLMIIAMEFAFTTRVEMTVVRNFKEDLEGYYYAFGGFEYAITEFLDQYDRVYLGPDGQIGFYRTWYEEKNNRLPTPVPAGENQDDTPPQWPPLPNRRHITIGNGFFDYSITDEEGRLNINYLDSRTKSGQKTNREIFRDLLVATGVEDGELPDVIIDSIIDWVDRNDEHHLNGAENDWYEKNYKEQGFTEPYGCKNSKIDSIDEMLMIRGMTPEILYGSNSIYARSGTDSQSYMGIAPYITVYGFQRTINTDTAPPLLLQILDSENAEQIMEDRQKSNTTKRSSRTFRIEVRGYSEASEVSHYLMAVVRRSNSKTGGGAEILYWNDHAPSLGADLLAYNYISDYNSQIMPGISGGS